MKQSPVRIAAVAEAVEDTAGAAATAGAVIAAADTVVAISFRRVDRVTLAVLRHAARVGASRVALTDGLSNSVARLADVALIARVGPLRLLPPFAPGASLVNAVLTAISHRMHLSAAQQLQTAERLWQEFDLHVER